MIIYLKDKDYKIWANTEDKKFYVQMNGEEIGKEGHSVAATAIVEAEDTISSRK